MISSTLAQSGARLFRKLAHGSAFSDAEHNALSELPLQIADLSRGHDIVREGDRPAQCFSLLSGFSSGVKSIMSGSRQIVAVHIPGDVPDLQSFYINRLDFSITTLTRCKVAFIQHEVLRDTCQKFPGISRSFSRELAAESARGREWIKNIGRRPGIGRISHLICEMMTRLRPIGLAEGKAFQFPMTQFELGDATGMSNVHVNRCLKDLRCLGVIQLERNNVKILDWVRLALIAEFDPLYLRFDD